MYVPGDTGFNISERSAIKDLEMLEQARRKFDENKNTGTGQDSEKSRATQLGYSEKGGAWKNHSAPKGGKSLTFACCMHVFSCLFVCLAGKDSGKGGKKNKGCEKQSWGHSRPNSGKRGSKGWEDNNHKRARPVFSLSKLCSMCPRMQ